MKTGIKLISIAVLLAGLGTIVWAAGPKMKNPFSKTKPAISRQVKVYKTDSCFCCVRWNEYMQNAKYNLVSQDMEFEKLSEYKTSLGIAPQLQSCHTAIIGGYVIEGHVPIKEIERLLKERPKAVGLTVPGMVSGSPGMENGRYEPYDVLLFFKDGTTKIYASY